MTDAIIELIVKVVCEIIIALIGVASAWLISKIGKCQQLTAISKAMEEVGNMAKQTVGELNQTVVSDLKSASADGKLTTDEINSIKQSLYEVVYKKMSTPTEELLSATGVDIVSLINGYAEDFINSMKNQ